MSIAVQGGVISFDELNGSSPKVTSRRETSENGSKQSREAVRIGKVAWTDINALIAECFPAPPALPGIYPGVAHLYAESLEAEPFNPGGEGPSTFDGTGDIAGYAHANVTIKYSTLKYDASTLISRKYGCAGEFMAIPADSNLIWENATIVAGANVVVDVEELSLNKVIPTIEHSITWHRVVTVPWTAIKENLGCVNNGVLNNNYFSNVTAQTLLYLGAEISFTYSSDGTQTWTVEHRFQERKITDAAGDYGWNHLWNPSAGEWDILADKDTGSRLYHPSSTFNDLFA